MVNGVIKMEKCQEKEYNLKMWLRRVCGFQSSRWKCCVKPTLIPAACSNNNLCINSVLELLCSCDKKSFFILIRYIFIY